MLKPADGEVGESGVDAGFSVSMILLLLSSCSELFQFQFQFRSEEFDCVFRVATSIPRVINGCWWGSLLLARKHCRQFYCWAVACFRYPAQVAPNHWAFL